MNYKDQNHKVHVIEPEFAHMLPEGCIAITEAEAEALRPKPPAPTYQQLRAAAYPPASDYLDGVVKGNQAQIDAYIATCLAVKAKYSK